MNDRPVDEPARRRSIETLDRPLVVEAGAGTGKTTLLVERIVHALACGAVRIPEVVALSFTEKAAAELGQRLRQELATAHRASATDPVRERLGAALADYDRATVGTIHAFAAALLRAHPVAARLDPHFVMLDELESQHLMRRFWERWAGAQMELPEAAAHLRRALACGVRLEPDLRDLAFEIYAQRDVEHLIARPALPVGLDAEVEALAADMTACIAHAETHCRQASDAGLVKLRALGEQLELLVDLEPENRVAFFMNEIGVAATAGRQDAWTPGEGAASKDMRRRIAVRLETLRRGIAADGLHRVLPWLADFRRAYDVEKRRRAVLDFQDLLLSARDLVRDDLAVRRALGERIRMLCVDEFQDTDPLQAEIVFFLAERSAPHAVTWQAVDVGASLFLVGDPRQSIYRFRRADLDVYGRCVERILASGGERIDIEQSFRSRPAILAWVNATFAARFGGATSMRHVPLIASASAGGPAAVWILRGEAADNADAARAAEADAIVRWLHAAVAAGVPVREREAVRPLRWGDIALLFARTSGIEAYEVALRAAGIPFQQEGGKLFFQRPEVRDVLAALAAVDDPRDELSLVAALRSPLGGATDAELWEHHAAHGGFDYSRDVAGSPLGQALSMLRTLHAERHGRGLSGTIAALLAATGARAFYAAAANGGAALSNLETLHRFASQFETGRPAGFREFVRVLRDFDEQAPRLAEWAPLEEEQDRVRLLTVHGAKGLEFPCVVLANLNARGNLRSGAVVVDRGADRAEVRLRCNDPQHFESAGYAAAAKRERVHAKEEEDRLLYVAATRGRDYVVVPDVSAGKRDALLETLASVAGALGTSAFGGLGEPGAGLDFGSAGPGWRVVAATALPPPPRPPAPLGGGGGAAAAAAELHARRAAWAGAHAARLARGRGVITETTDP